MSKELEEVSFKFIEVIGLLWVQSFYAGLQYPTHLSAILSQQLLVCPLYYFVLYAGLVEEVENDMHELRAVHKFRELLLVIGIQQVSDIVPDLDEILPQVGVPLLGVDYTHEEDGKLSWVQIWEFACSVCCQFFDKLTSRLRVFAFDASGKVVAGLEVPNVKLANKSEDGLDYDVFPEAEGRTLLFRLRLLHAEFSK